jgi:amino acid transporter
MARERLLPTKLASTHEKHKTPHLASMLVTVLVLLWIVGFTAEDSSDSAALLKLGTYVPLFGVLGLLFVQALTSAAIVRYFLTEARDGFHWWRTLVAPIIGGAAMIGACYLLIANRAALSGAGGVLFIQAIPWAILVTFIVGVGIGLYYRLADNVTHQSIGRVVFQEEPPIAAMPMPEPTLG